MPLAVLLALSLTSARAAAQPTPQVFVRSQTVVDALQYRGLDGRAVTRRAVRERVAIFWLGAQNSPWTGTFVGSYSFDAELEGDPEPFQLAERQLEPGLEQAFVTRSFGDFGHVSLGRQIRHTRLGLTRVDGAWLSWESPRGLRLQALSGLRPESAARTIDSWFFEDDGDPERRRELRNAAFVNALSAGWQEGAFGGGLGFHQESSVGDGIIYRRAVQLDASWGVSHNLRASYRHDLVYGLPERLDFFGRVEVSDTLAFHLRSTTARPVFPLDNAFSVFPMTAFAEHEAGVTHSDDTRTIAAALTLRSQADRELSMPWGSGAERKLGGGRVRWTSLSSSRRWRFEADGAVAANTVSHRASGGLRLARSFAPGPTLHAALRGQSWRDDRSALDSALGAFVQVGLSAFATDWARISLANTAGFDNVNRLSLRMFAQLDLRLPGDNR